MLLAVRLFSVMFANGLSVPQYSIFLGRALAAAAATAAGGPDWLEAGPLALVGAGTSPLVGFCLERGLLPLPGVGPFPDGS